MTDEQIARVAHEVNRAYCEALGDASQVPWEDAPDWQRASAVSGVRLHRSGDHGPEASHEHWRAEKLADGWVYGETKDPEAKTHPCLVPFAELPAEQQAKDYLFRAVVHALRDGGLVDETVAPTPFVAPADAGEAPVATGPSLEGFLRGFQHIGKVTLQCHIPRSGPVTLAVRDIAQTQTFEAVVDGNHLRPQG